MNLSSQTVGNWTIDDLVVDSSSSATKNLAVGDLAFSADYTKSSVLPEEVILTNITGTELTPPETLRYARTIVKDVYANSEISAPQRHAVKSGIRTLAEVKFNLKAVNSVSGDEVYIPLRGWICLQIPSVNLITPDIVGYLVQRTVATMLPAGAVTPSTLAMKMARGDLDPA